MSFTRSRKGQASIGVLIFIVLAVLASTIPASHNDVSALCCVPNPDGSTKFTVESYCEGRTEGVNILGVQVKATLKENGWTVDSQSVTGDRLVIEAHRADVRYKAEARVDGGRFKMWATMKQGEWQKEDKPCTRTQ